MKLNGRYVRIFLVYGLIVITPMSVIYTNSIKMVNADSLSQQLQFNPVKLGQSLTGGLANDIQVVDNTAYIADWNNGLLLFNISNPDDPQQLSSVYDGSGAANDLFIYDDFAFVADGEDGLEIINIGHPEYPIEIGSFYDGGQAHGVSVMGYNAFVADGEDGLEVIDVSDPENPTEIAQYNLSGPYHEISLVEGIAIVSNHVVIDGILQYSELNFLNISDVNNITEIASFDPGYGRYFCYSAIAGNIGYFSIHGQSMIIKIFDFSDLSNIREIGLYDVGDGGAPNKMEVIDDILYIAGGPEGLLIIDVSNPINPVEVGNYFDGGYAYDVQVIGNLAYVADRQDGLEIIQLYEDTKSETSTISGFEFFLPFSVLSILLLIEKKGMRRKT